jgi:hypothetical protein
MDSKDDWTWPNRPTTVAEFDTMMSHLDRHLAIHNLLPAQRSLNAARLVSMALKLSGTPILVGNEARGEPFSPRDLLARVFDWYDDTYGDRNKIDFSLGYVVLPLRNTYWRLRIPLAYGTVVPFADRNLANLGRQLGKLGTKTEPASHNVLTGLQGVTQAYSDRLTDAEIARVMQAYGRGYIAMATLDELREHDLFDQARGDYAHSVEALAGGQAFSKARWDTAQCAEKVFKGLLGRAGQPFPTSAGQGHDIVHLGGLVTAHFGIALPEGALRAIYCSPKVRYGEINVDLNEAWTSHDALLGILARLRAIALPPGGKQLRR